jgi:hypothetical protein
MQPPRHEYLVSYKALRRCQEPFSLGSREKGLLDWSPLSAISSYTRWVLLDPFRGTGLPFYGRNSRQSVKPRAVSGRKWALGTRLEEVPRRRASQNVLGSLKRAPIPQRGWGISNLLLLGRRRARVSPRVATSCQKIIMPLRSTRSQDPLNQNQEE